MNGSHDRRLAKLELDRRPAATLFYVWCDGPPETTRQAIARSFPAGVPADARLVICSWQAAGERSISHRLARPRPGHCQRSGRNAPR